MGHGRRCRHRYHRREITIVAELVFLLLVVTCTNIANGFPTSASSKSTSDGSQHQKQSTKEISSISAAPTIRNPHSNRLIRVGGPTYQKFLGENGRWIQHGGTFLPLDLAALHSHQEGRKASKRLHATSTIEGEEDKQKQHHTIFPNDWHCILPSVVVAGASTSSSSSDDSSQLHHHRRPLTPMEAASLERELLFVHKPSGLNCVPSRNGSDPSLSSEVATAYGPDAKPCHRLDRDTSGVVVFGLTAKAHRDVSKQFEARTTDKTYLALVSGHPPPTGTDTDTGDNSSNEDEGIIDLPIGKKKTAEGYNRWAIGGEKSRQAVTEWKVDKRYTTATSEKGAGCYFSRMKLSPKTGRGHQLRLHMKSIGCPILGDTLHATDTGVAACAPRLCLHAWKLELDWNGLRLEVESVAPF